MNEWMNSLSHYNFFLTFLFSGKNVFKHTCTSRLIYRQRKLMNQVHTEKLAKIFHKIMRKKKYPKLKDSIFLTSIFFSQKFLLPKERKIQRAWSNIFLSGNLQMHFNWQYKKKFYRNYCNKSLLEIHSQCFFKAVLLSYRLK